MLVIRSAMLTMVVRCVCVQSLYGCRVTPHSPLIRYTAVTPSLDFILYLSSAAVGRVPEKEPQPHSLQKAPGPAIYIKLDLLRAPRVGQGGGAVAGWCSIHPLSAVQYHTFSISTCRNSYDPI